MKIRILLISAFSILVLVFVTVFLINKRLSEEVLTNANYLNNSEAIIRNSNMLHKEIIEMQSGFRGFLLTGQEVFLQPYYHGLQIVPLLVKDQRNLISSVSQQLRLDTIIWLHKEWVDYSDSLILSKKDTLPEAGLKYKRLFDQKLKMEVGKKLNDQIRVQFRIFDNHEYQIRQTRRANLQNAVVRTENIALSIMIASGLLAFSLIFFVVKTISSRISKMVGHAERISKGEFIQIEDTRRDEFKTLVISLNQMSGKLEKNFDELKRKNHELDQFAYAVSHDLKAPLRGIDNIISWTEEDHEKDLIPDIRNNLDLIKGRVNRLENMINGLLEYARVGKSKKGLEKVDLNKMIEEIKDLIVPDSVSLVISSHLPTIIAERIPLEQVFSNLISNAVKHNHANEPHIKIDFSERDEYYEFSINDNGPGIQKEYFEKIFQIFQTLQERDAFETTGVGLAIVKKVIEDNEGTIDVISEIGKGTTFVFQWPKIGSKKYEDNFINR